MIFRFSLFDLCFFCLFRFSVFFCPGSKPGLYGVSKARRCKFVGTGGKLQSENVWFHCLLMTFVPSQQHRFFLCPPVCWLEFPLDVRAGEL